MESSLAKMKTKRFKVKQLPFAFLLSVQVKHPKRKLFRANDPVLSVFMWGINHTVKVKTVFHRET